MFMQKYLENLNPELKKYLEILSKEFPLFLLPYLKTKTLTRLKDVSYFCAMEYGSKNLYNFKYYISRYYHSISTALIIWNFTKDEEMTLSALFHDARTPATSHVIDYLNKDYIKQESTEDGLKETLNKDRELLSLLRKDNIDIDNIINFKKYSLVDSKRPKLCADRMDGLFLTSLAWSKNITINEVQKIYNDITLISNEYRDLEFNFNTKEIAKKVVKLNDKINELTNDVYEFNSMNLCAIMIKYVIDKKIINYDDLFILTDKKLFNIINNKRKQDKKLNELFNNFKHLENIQTNNIPPLKQRTLNPLFLGKRLK